MNRGDDCTGQFKGDRLSPVLRHPELLSQKCLSRRGAECDDDARFHLADLLHQPGRAGAYLPGTWLFMQTPASLDHHELEMLDRVGHVNSPAVDARVFECSIQQLAGGADERVTGSVFLVPWLLADQHDFSPSRSFAEDCLRGVQPKMAATTLPGRFLQLG